LTFKPNTDDMRDAPSIAIAQALLDAGATVLAYDPEGMAAAREIMPDLVYCDTPYAVAQGAGCVALVTEWNEFRALDLEKLGSVMTDRVFVDLRNVYQPDEVIRHGFTYHSVGRG
jgi:UDPglucose 6-dehydrogenase